jgi:hypothetical protein
MTELEGQAPLFTMALLMCTCDHPAAAHDDGFGCTEPIDPAQDPDTPCPCLGRWVGPDRNEA